MRARACLLALAVLGALGACGGDDKPEFAAEASPAPLYDVYFGAIDNESGGRSALYGLSLNPLRAHRLSVGEGALAATAPGERVVVVGAGDEGFGRLQPDGTIAAIPGLGRPDGNDPYLLSDGRIRWSDESKGAQRYLEWDPATGRKKVLDQVRSEGYVEFASGPGNGWVRAVEIEKGSYQLSVVTGKKTYTHKPSSAPMHLSAGRDLIAARVENPDQSADSDHLLLFFDPRRGKLRDLENMQPIAWSPGGRRMLAVTERFAADPQEVREIWFSADAVAHRPLGELPAMQVGHGSWRTGIPAPL